jgi:hypothetical protein
MQGLAEGGAEIDMEWFVYSLRPLKDNGVKGKA